MNQDYDSLDFDYVQTLLPREKSILTIKEVSRFIGKSAQFVRDAIKHGHLLAFVFQGRSLGKAQQRKSYLIPYFAVLLFLLNHGNSTSQSYSDQVLRFVQSCSKEQLQFVQQTINKKLSELEGLKGA